MGIIHPTSPMTRRTLLGAGAAALVLGHPLTALAARGTTEERAIALKHLHTGESISCPYWSDGTYLRNSLEEINHVLRDHRSGSETDMDPELLDLLWMVRQRSGSRATIEVFSGYRSPATNAMLRSRSRGVAKRSYHTRGKAADVRIPGVSTQQLVRAARSLGRGGVGYYPRSGFVHIDTGPARYWRG